jgi:hypothetical protein
MMRNRRAQAFEAGLIQANNGDPTAATPSFGHDDLADRLEIIVGELGQLQEDAQQEGRHGLVGNINQALSYLNASRQALRH